MPSSALINVMVQAARKAGRGLSRDFGEVEQLQVSVKGPGDFVSAADLKAEQVLIEELQRVRPGYGILAEEQGAIAGADKTHRWIIDPLDGTTNFLHGFPMFAISIGLERDGEMVAGVIYNPVTDELFTAEKGSGAFLNDRRIRVAGRNKLAESMITCGVPHHGRGDHPLFLKQLAAVMPRVSGIRRTGSAALDLAYLAAGRVDGYWESSLSSWDMAAGIIILREAGGTITDETGRGDMMNSGSLVAGNEGIQRDLLKLLKSVE